MKYVNFCLTVIVAFMLSAGSIDTRAPHEGYWPGEMVPNLVLTGMDGNTRQLHDYKGKKVVVNFWVSHDARSRAANARLHNILQTEEMDVVFLSVSFDENRNVVERTMALDSLDPASLFSEINGTSSKLYKELKLDKGFRNYLIGENGEIAAMNVSPEDLKTLF